MGAFNETLNSGSPGLILSLAPLSLWAQLKSINLSISHLASAMHLMQVAWYSQMDNGMPA